MGRTLFKRVAPLFGVGVTLVAVTMGLAAETPAGFVPAIFPRSAELTAQQRRQVVEGLAAQQPDPQHVVVLIHGFDTPTFASTEQYNVVAPKVRAEYERLGERAAILGIQWDSNVGPRRKWIPAVFGHYLFSMVGLRKVIRDPYTSRIPIARTLGRTGLRQLLFEVQDRFPAARLQIMGHSMAAEAVAHAINPDYTPRKGEPVFQEERPLKLDVVALAGADLDFDSGARSTPVNPAAAPKLLWVTLPKVGSRKDKVLTLRKKVRSRAAVGNAVPAFRQDQYDTLVANRRLVFDSIDIPENHALTEYFGGGRLARIAAAAVGIRNPAQNPSPLLKAMDAVLAAPAEVGAIAPHLLGGETTPKVYALWRLEHLLCGSSAHMSSGYAEKVLSETLKDPAWLDQERPVSPCRVVKEGYWPPVDVVEASRQRHAKKNVGNPKEPREEPPVRGNQGFFTQPVVPALAGARQR